MHSLLFETIREELRVKTDAIFQYLENETNITDTTIYHHCCDKIDFWNLVETDERKCGSCVYAHMTDGVFLHDHYICDICGKSYSIKQFPLNDISLNDIWIYGRDTFFSLITGMSRLFCQ